MPLPPKFRKFILENGGIFLEHEGNVFENGGIVF